MEEFIHRLKGRLTRDLPGEEAQYRMAPRTRLRMREALSEATRPQQSAVLLYLFPQQSDWRIVLMKRPEYDGAHGGQVSIPGGRLEPGEDHTQAAAGIQRRDGGVCQEQSTARQAQ